MLTLCWLLCLAQVAVLFFVGQLLIPDSVIVLWLGNLNPQLQMIGRGLMDWLVKNPHISVHSVYNFFMYFFSTRLIGPSIVAVALAIPHLISRDLAGNAMVVYSSKAIGRFDYFLGKFGVLFGLLCLTWLGPVCVVWFMGNLLATDWNFFWHSRAALGNALIFVLSGMVALSFLGLGVSAISPREKNTVALWVAWWLVGNALVPLGRRTNTWLEYLSFQFDLKQISLAVFRLQADLEAARENLPFFGEMLQGVRRTTLAAMENPEWIRPALALALMSGLAAVVVGRRVRPQ